MAKIIVKRGMPGDDTHLGNALDYVSDGRALMIGGNGVDYTDPNEAYRQMNAVKEYYEKLFARSYDYVISEKCE